jgi:hypothetical protein
MRNIVSSARLYCGREVASALMDRTSSVPAAMAAVVATLFFARKASICNVQQLLVA